MHDPMHIVPDSPSALPLLPGLNGRRLVLASASPRRKQLLSMLGIPFDVRPIGVDEIYPDTLSGPEIPRFLSELKARAALDTLAPEEILITSDTVVQLDGETLEKPGSADEALGMIMKLSGNTHQVVTAFCVVDGRQPDALNTDHDIVEVSFEHLSSEFALHYIENHHPFDKAGGYGAQDLIGACAIHSLKGSYYTVMGLPMHKIFSALQRLD
jgi:septum formation protein